MTLLFLLFYVLILVSFCMCWSFFPSSIYCFGFILFDLFVSPLLYMVKRLERSCCFSDNSIDHCHKILKVEKKKKKSTSSPKRNWFSILMLHCYGAPTPQKLSINHILPPTQPREEGCWGRSVLLHVPCLSVVWHQCDLMSHPCPTQSWAALNPSGRSKRLRTGGCI